MAFTLAARRSFARGRSGRFLRIVGGLALVMALRSAPLLAAGAGWPDLSAPAVQGGGERDAAVVVVISDYYKQPDVPGALQNAADWQKWLRGRGVPHVAVLRDGAATDIEIKRAAEAAAEAVQPAGTLWFVFIGHGARTTDGTDGLLVGHDAPSDDEGLTARSVPRATLEALLSAGEQARTVLVVDACFSGKASDSGEPLTDTQATLPNRPRFGTDPRLVLLTAGGADEFAGPLPDVGRPAFSYLVLGALRGWADRDPYVGDGDGKVSAKEVVEFTRAALGSLVHGRTQTPELHPKDSPAILATQATEVGPNIDAIAMGYVPPPETRSGAHRIGLRYGWRALAPEAVVPDHAVMLRWEFQTDLWLFSAEAGYGLARRDYESWGYDLDGVLTRIGAGVGLDWGPFRFDAMADFEVGFLHQSYSDETASRWSPYYLLGGHVGGIWPRQARAGLRLTAGGGALNASGDGQRAPRFWSGLFEVCGGVWFVF